MGAQTDEDYARLCALAGPVSRETFSRLKNFESEFLRWAPRVNLVAPSTLDSVWERHILDSAQLRKLKPSNRSWLDIGSGGGFPGAILAILAAENAEIVDLVESNGKKTAFLATVLAKVGAPARIHKCRIEQARGRIADPGVVTARALAPLPALLEFAFPWLGAGSCGLFHKGRDYRAEIEESRNIWGFDLVIHNSLVHPEGVILEVTNLVRRDMRPTA